MSEHGNELPPKVIERYKKVLENHSILVGDEDEDGVDYSHMNFILSLDLGIKEDSNFYEIMKMFWKKNYPHHKKLLTNYEKLYGQFRALLDDQEAVLVKDAETQHELKLYKNYVKNNGLAYGAKLYVEKEVGKAKEIAKKLEEGMKDIKTKVLKSVADKRF